MHVTEDEKIQMLMGLINTDRFHKQQSSASLLMRHVRIGIDERIKCDITSGRTAS